MQVMDYFINLAQDITSFYFLTFLSLRCLQAFSYVCDWCMCGSLTGDEDQEWF